MTFDPATHPRRSIRLPEYDYSQSGAYFLTICTQKRQCLFGTINDDILQLNDAGLMVTKWYLELSNKFSDIECGEFVCMPNHIHAIIRNVGANLCVRPHQHLQANTSKGDHIGSPLHRIVGWFKTMTTNAYIRGVKTHGWPRFAGTLWQRNYWEHIVRDEEDLYRITEYIQNNPAQWELDQLFVRPDRQMPEKPSDTRPRIQTLDPGQKKIFGRSWVMKDD